MCEQCSAATITYGEIVPGFWLVRATQQGNTMVLGDWGLVESNDPHFVWQGDIVPDPTEGLSDEDLETMTPEQEQAEKLFYDNFEAIRFMDLPVSAGWRLVQAGIQAGYQPEKIAGDFPYWLYCRMAKLVQDHKS